MIGSEDFAPSLILVRAALSVQSSCMNFFCSALVAGSVLALGVACASSPLFAEALGVASALRLSVTARPCVVALGDGVAVDVSVALSEPVALSVALPPDEALGDGVAD